MQLSEGQTFAAEHGTQNWQWKPIEMPVGEIKLPKWLTGLELQDMDDTYANRPSFKLKTTPEFTLGWDGMRYSYDRIRQLYYAIHPIDEYAEFMGAGPLGMHDVEVFKGKGPDGKGLWVKEPLLCTSATEGMGGRQFKIVMDDGSYAGQTATIRGYWHGGHLPGYQEASYYPKGFKEMGYFGLFVTQDLLVRAIAKFQPHLRAAMVKIGSIEHVEPYVDGGVPKGF